MYSLAGYGLMINDAKRMAAYTAALRQALRPGDIVADIGAGAGIFALLACQMGASHVYAIEPAPAVHVGREIAAQNGFADRITFLQTLSTQVTLPQLADVIISDLRDILPLHGRHLPAIQDARQRLLAPGGLLIPQRDDIWAAVVHAPDMYQSYDSPWVDNAYGLDMSAARRILTNEWRKAQLRGEQLLTAPQRWLTLDYATVTDWSYAKDLTWTAVAPGVGHGIAVWFDACLSGDICFSNRPGDDELIYGQAFFPWSQPVALNEGDVIQLALRARLGEADYDWHWQTKIWRGRDPEGKPDYHFRQDSFLATPISPARLHARQADYQPQPSTETAVAQFVLSQIDGRASLSQITERLMSQFPDRFESSTAALSCAAAIAQRFTPNQQL
jgi:type I protein arginine methyltransferase